MQITELTHSLSLLSCVPVLPAAPQPLLLAYMRSCAASVLILWPSAWRSLSLGSQNCDCRGELPCLGAEAGCGEGQGPGSEWPCSTKACLPRTLQDIIPLLCCFSHFGKKRPCYLYCINKSNHLVFLDNCNLIVFLISQS